MYNELLSFITENCKLIRHSKKSHTNCNSKRVSIKKYLLR